MRRAPSGRGHLLPPRGAKHLFTWLFPFLALFLALPAFAAPDLFDGFRPPVGADPDSLLLTDLNADGKPDIVVGNCGSRDISVLLGKGDGTFNPEVRYPVTVCPGQIAALDFTSDGKVDLALISTGTILILAGDGAGGLGPATFGGVAGAADGTLLGGDFNSDGKKDLVAAGGTPSNLVVFLGKGDGTFQTGVPYPTVGASLVGADFNGDGRLDIAASAFDSGAQSVTIAVHVGNPDGSFTLSDSIVVTTSQFFLVPHVVAGKLSGDAQTDLMVADLLETQLLAGLGDGTFGDPAPVAFLSTGLWVFAGDFNADGKDDLITGSQKTVDLFRQGSNGTFEAYGSHPVGFSWRDLALADLDSDGDRDLAVLNDHDDISVLLAPSFARPGPEFHHPTPPGVWALETADLQRDGRPDLLAVSPDYSLFWEFLGTGAGAFSSVEVDAPIFGATGLAAADQNGDGNRDLVFNGLFSDVTELLGKGDGLYQNPAITFPPGDTRGPVLAADFNEDDHQDLIVSTGILLWILQGKGDGTFEFPAFIAGELYADATASGYLNGDAHRDLVVAGVKGVSIFLGAGDLSFTPLPDLSLPSRPFAIAVADLDHDSHMDIVAALDDGRVAVLKNDGNGAFTPTFFPAGGQLADVAVADFDADDILDVAVADSREQAFEILLGRGDATFENPLRYQAGVMPTSLVAADFDVDGRLDVAISNGSTDAFFADFAQIVIYLNHGPYPVCHDGDGDGFGLPGNPVCSGGSAADCDDSRGAVFPGHAEICDSRDNDCDGMTDEGFPDEDDDAAADCADDCFLIWNPDQADSDADGVGDACEESTLFSNANLSSAGFSAGRVDGRDLEIFATAFGTCPGDAGFNDAANLDRIPVSAGAPGSCVSSSDFHLFMEAFGEVH